MQISLHLGVPILNIVISGKWTRGNLRKVGTWTAEA